MLAFESSKLAFEALWANRLRTALTMLGMIVGVFAVIVLVSLGQGAKNYILAEFEGLGSNIIIIQPGKADKKTNFAPPIGASQKKLTLLDVAALEKRALNISAVTGLLLGTAAIRYEDSISNNNVFGANEQFPNILNLPFAQGSYFTRDDDSTGRRVVVLGSTLSQILFGNEYPIGKMIKISQSEFRVLAVLSPMGDKLGFNLDEFAIIPTTAALRLFNEDKLFGIRAKASSKASVEDAVSEIEDILKERRNGKEDFTIVTQGALMESMNTILNMLSYVLGGIAAISMLVGGIGIMNIMLVSVTERTSEIGIRRAVGAKRSHILVQFIFEAGLLSLLSGSAGVLGAYAAIIITNTFLTSFKLAAPLWIVIPSFLLAFAVGVIFGVWPARMASRIEILDALRYE
jgi:putative ABC transport system permease protein